VKDQTPDADTDRSRQADVRNRLKNSKSISTFATKNLKNSGEETVLSRRRNLMENHGQCRAQTLRRKLLAMRPRRAVIACSRDHIVPFECVRIHPGQFEEDGKTGASIPGSAFTVSSL